MDFGFDARNGFLQVSGLWKGPLNSLYWPAKVTGPFSRLKVSYGAEGRTEGGAALFGPTRSIVPTLVEIGEKKVRKVHLEAGF